MALYNVTMMAVVFFFFFFLRTTIYYLILALNREEFLLRLADVFSNLNSFFHAELVVSPMKFLIQNVEVGLNSWVTCMFDEVFNAIS